MNEIKIEKPTKLNQLINKALTITKDLNSDGKYSESQMAELLLFAKDQLLYPRDGDRRNPVDIVKHTISLLQNGDVSLEDIIEDYIGEWEYKNDEEYNGLFKTNNEVKRLQKLAGIDEIKINEPNKHFEARVYDIYDGINYYEIFPKNIGIEYEGYDYDDNNKEYITIDFYLEFEDGDEVLEEILNNYNILISFLNKYNIKYEAEENKNIIKWIIINKKYFIIK